MGDDVTPLLKVHEYFRGAPDGALAEVARHARVAHHPAGAVVHEANVLPTEVGFVLRGRLKCVRVAADGTESLLKMVGRGEQFGMMAGALAEPVPVRVVALEPTTVLELDYELAMDLTIRFQDLRRLWLKTYAAGLRTQLFGTVTRRAPVMVALIHETPASRPAAERLVARLVEVGESIAVFGESDAWQGLSGVRYRPLGELEPEDVRGQAAEWH